MMVTKPYWLKPSDSSPAAAPPEPAPPAKRTLTARSYAKHPTLIRSVHSHDPLDVLATRYFPTDPPLLPDGTVDVREQLRRWDEQYNRGAGDPR